MSTTEKRHDIIADMLTIREMTLIIHGLHRFIGMHPDRRDMEDALTLQDLVWEARNTAMRNEYAGDYDYPDDTE